MAGEKGKKNRRTDKTNPVITLITDFGVRDWFVGSMKGVIAGICPAARVIDITHQIPPGDVRQAAISLECSYRYFPAGTVHLVVVDPGVGTDRRVLALSMNGYRFVVPDNGVISYLLTGGGDPVIFQATRKDLFLHEISNTFHGRDIFAPLAAHLAGGLSPAETGPEYTNPVAFSVPGAGYSGTDWDLTIIGKDRFGNLMTSLSKTGHRNLPLPEEGQELLLRTGEREYRLLVIGSYASRKQGLPLAIWGSCGYLELALSGGDASRFFGVEPGNRCRVMPFNRSGYGEQR